MCPTWNTHVNVASYYRLRDDRGWTRQWPKQKLHDTCTDSSSDHTLTDNTMKAHELRTGYNRALRLAKWPAPQHKMRDRKWPENEHPAQLLRLRPLITQHTCDDLTQCTNVNCLIRRRKSLSWLPRATRSNNARSPVKHTLAASSGAPVRPTTNRSDEWQFETRAAISIAVLCF